MTRASWHERVVEDIPMGALEMHDIAASLKVTAIADLMSVDMDKLIEM